MILPSARKQIVYTGIERVVEGIELCLHPNKLSQKITRVLMKEIIR